MVAWYLVASLNLSIFSGSVALPLVVGTSQTQPQLTTSLIDHTHSSSTHQTNALMKEDVSIGTVGHRLSVVIDPAEHFISVKDTVMLPATVRGAGTEFTLNSALTITSSTPAVRNLGVIESGHGPKRTRYAFESDAPADEFALSYEGVINFDLADEKEQYSKGMRETHGILGPEGIYLSGATAWIPQFADEMIRFTAEVETPADWHVISQGNGSSNAPGASEGTRRAVWDSGTDLEQIYLVGGPLMVQSEMAGSVEVLVYLHEQDEALSQKYLDTTARYIEMYRKLIGAYPYEKFALVENFWETGYGMPSFTLLGEQVIRLPFILHSSYPHEILHNWWGNSVFVDYESGNWCEGLTAYMADHLIQEQREKGDTYRRGSLQKYRNYVKDGQDFPLSEFRSRHSPATEAIGYGKSLMLFHMLRQRVGDDSFRAAMADFYEKNRGRRASFDDIRLSFESVTGDDFSLFFAQWVERAGAPSIGLRDVKAVGPSAWGDFTITGVIEQTQSADAYALSIPISVAVEGGQELFHVESKSKEHAFSLTTKSRPKALSVDPMFDLFRLLDPREIPSSIGQIFGEPRILAVLPSGEDAEPYRKLMEGWHTDNHDIEIVFDNEIESLPDDRGVWVLGRTNRFAATALWLDRRVDASHRVESVALGDDLVETDGNSVVVIRRHPSNPEKAIGWISVDPKTAFSGFARKLPHYGKYSYLAFEGQEPTNFVKGQWETSESPLIVELESGGSALLVAEPRKALAELPPVFSQHKLQQHVQWLAAPEREGRGLGSVGLNDSAHYIAERFEAAGLEPAGDDGTWFQHFQVEQGPDGKPTQAMNVVGVLPGSRTEWADQSVVIGAHYDHLGLGWPDVRAGNEGMIHFGADDNASGVSVLIELARVMAAEGGGSRNLVFIAFSSEEAGLLGSKHYVTHPRYPVKGMRGMVNMDTVGNLYGNALSIHETGTADEWQHIFRGIGFVTGIKCKSIAARIGGSDQESFINAGVPAVQFFTGARADYHRPTDTPNKVDFAGLVKVATVAKETVSYLIEREEPMTVRIEGVQAAPSHKAKSKSGGRRVSFGTVPQFEFTGPGVKVDSVVPDSPADQAGVQAGDVLIRIDDIEIDSLRAFSQHLKTLVPGQEVIATVLRDGIEISLPIRVQAR